MATGAAKPQVNPAIACFEAFFAALGAGRNRLNLVGVRTG